MFHWLANHWKTIVVIAASTVVFAAVTALTGGLGAPAMVALLAGGFSSGVAGSVLSSWLDGKTPSAKDALIQGGVAAVLTVATVGVGRLVAPLISRAFAPAAAPAVTESLVHFTTAEGRAGIEMSNQLLGSQGIFAVPERAVAESTLAKVARTGISPSRTVTYVKIPEAAASLFKQPVPIGPYSLIKYLGGVHYAPAGAIDMTTGALIPRTGGVIGARALMYGPDLLAYGAAATVAAAKEAERALDGPPEPVPMPAPPPTSKGLAGALGDITK